MNEPLPKTIDAVIARLETIVDDAIHHSSRLGYFAVLYLKVTVEVKQKIQEHYFEDNARMERLDVVFANRYIAAYEAYQEKGTCSESWKIAFEAAKQWPPLVLQHLFGGMNAHIGLDLGIAAAEIQPNHIEDLQEDFNRINTILSNLIDDVQAQVSHVFPLLKPIDWLAGGTDEKIAKFSIDIARDAAWQQAVDYAALTTETQKTTFIKHRDASLARFGTTLLHPKGLLKMIILAFRLFEFGSVQQKLKKLNRLNGQED